MSLDLEAPIAVTLANFETLDVAGLTTTRDQLAARTDEMRDAIDGAKARAEELDRQAKQREWDGPDKNIVANAVLRGEDIMEAQPSAAMLRDRAETERAGIQGLRERKQDCGVEEKSFLAHCHAIVVGALSPLTDALKAKVGGGGSLGDLQASYQALHAATRHLHFGYAAGALRKAREALAEGQLIERTEPVTPPELVNFLDLVQPTLAALLSKN